MGRSRLRCLTLHAASQIWGTCRQAWSLWPVREPHNQQGEGGGQARGQQGGGKGGGRQAQGQRGAGGSANTKCSPRGEENRRGRVPPPCTADFMT